MGFFIDSEDLWFNYNEFLETNLRDSSDRAQQGNANVRRRRFYQKAVVIPYHSRGRGGVDSRSGVDVDGVHELRGALHREPRHRRLRHLPQRLPLLLRQQGPPSRVRELPPARSGKPTAHRPSASGGHRHAGRPEEPTRATSAPSGCIYPVQIVTWSCGSTREAARDSGLRSGCHAAR